MWSLILAGVLGLYEQEPHETGQVGMSLVYGNPLGCGDKLGQLFLCVGV